MTKDIYNRIPIKSIKLIQKWINELSLEVVLRPPRVTRLGDFKILSEKKCVISINNDLNPYSSLITLTHEIAHAFVWKEHRRTVLPHGDEWKLTFRKLMLNFLDCQIFPDKILKHLSKHLINPKASTTTDILLYKSLLEFNNKKSITISDINNGEMFFLKNGKKLIKTEKLRTRFKCKEYMSNKTYLVHPLAEITRI